MAKKLKEEILFLGEIITMPLESVFIKRLDELISKILPKFLYFIQNTIEHKKSKSTNLYGYKHQVLANSLMVVLVGEKGNPPTSQV